MALLPQRLVQGVAQQDHPTFGQQCLQALAQNDAALPADGAAHFSRGKGEQVAAAVIAQPEQDRQRPAAAQAPGLFPGKL